MVSRYRHRRTSTAGTSFPSPVEPGEIVVNTSNRQIAVGDAAGGTLGAPLNLLATRVFDARAQYAAGEFVVNGGNLYCSKATVTPGAFNATQWNLYSSDTALNVPSKSYIDTGDANVTTAFQAADATVTTSYQAADTALQTSINGKVAKIGDTMTGPLALPAGSQGVPSVNFGSTDTGLYGGTTVRITVTGITRVTVSNANVTSTLPVVLPANPTNALEAAPKQYVDAVQTNVNLKADKTYVDAQDALKVAKAGDTMTGPLVLPADPTLALQAATKQYVDNKPSGSSLTIADTAPTGLPVGSLWWESDTGLLYVYYNDGTSTQWVIACPQPDLTTFALKTDLTSYVAKAGDTMTGNLGLASANPQLIFNKSVGGANFIYGQQAGKMRWMMLPGDNTAEGGSNSGSDFYIYSYDDTGANPTQVLGINRASGLASVKGDPTGVLGIATKQYVDNHSSAAPPAATTAEYVSNSQPTKMLTPGAVWGAGNAVGMTDGATVTPNLATGIDLICSLGTGRTLANPINGKAGQRGFLWFIGGSITAWGTAYKFPGGTKPTSTGGMDIISYCVGGDNVSMYCNFAGNCS